MYYFRVKKTHQWVKPLEKQKKSILEEFLSPENENFSEKLGYLSF